MQKVIFKKKTPGTSIADHFDFIAGISTGGILTGLYLAPEDETDKKSKYTAADALDFYVQNGNHIFNKSKVKNWKRLWGLINATEYDSKNLEQLLMAKFGNLLLSKLLKPCLITTYNLKTKSAFFFGSKVPLLRLNLLAGFKDNALNNLGKLIELL